MKNVNSQKEIQRLKNCDILKHFVGIIICIICIGREPLGGLTEKTHDIQNGLFLKMVGLLKKYDPVI